MAVRVLKLSREGQSSEVMSSLLGRSLVPQTGAKILSQSFRITDQGSEMKGPDRLRIVVADDPFGARGEGQGFIHVHADGKTPAILAVLVISQVDIPAALDSCRSNRS
jgi:hypothetical protein